MSGAFDFSPELIVYDFDGVMTDNTALIDERGNEFVFVHRGDGYGVRMIRDRLRIPQIILSTEENPVVTRRAEKLKIPVIHNAGDGKAAILKAYALEQGYRMDRILYIGNDLNDYEAMTLCGFRCCPADAEREIRAIADYIFDSPGGRGVIREFYRILSEAENES